MKYLPPLLTGGWLALSAMASIVHAQTPATPADPFVKNPPDAATAQAKAGWQNCFIVFESYALDKNDAQSVIEGERGGAARYRRTLELAKAGKARLETLMALANKSGERAIVEAIDEVRYATEFTAPVDDKGIAFPTAWETRNAGDTLEVEPVILEDGRSCDLNLVPQRTTLAGLRDLPGSKGEAPIAQPTFLSQKLTTSTTATNGEPLYLGTYTPPPESTAETKGNEVWLAFLHVNLQGPAAKEAGPAPKATRSGLLNFEYSVYSLDRTLAHELLTTPGPLGAAWEKLQALVAEKKASFEHLTTITAKSGQRVVTEETREERYATEFSPGGRMGAVESTERTIYSGPSNTPAKPDGKKDYSGSTTTTESATVRREAADAARTPWYASAFETRNTGVSVELEPVISPDGQSVEINQVVGQSTLLGNLKAVGVAEQYPWQPLFESRKLTHALTAPIGVHVLAGTLSPPGADGVNDRADTGRTWVLFLRATPDEP